MAPGKTGTDPVDEMVDDINNIVVVQPDVDHLLLRCSQIATFSPSPAWRPVGTTTSMAMKHKARGQQTA